MSITSQHQSHKKLLCDWSCDVIDMFVTFQVCHTEIICRCFLSITSQDQSHKNMYSRKKHLQIISVWQAWNVTNMSITSQHQSHKKHVQQKETSTNYLSVTDLKWLWDWSCDVIDMFVTFQVCHTEIICRCFFLLYMFFVWLILWCYWHVCYISSQHVQQEETSTNYLSVTDLKCNKHVNNITGSVTQKTCRAERNIYKLFQVCHTEIICRCFFLLYMFLCDWSCDIIDMFVTFQVCHTEIICRCFFLSVCQTWNVTNMSITSQHQSHKKHVQQKETSTNYLSVTDLK
jgi:hypothetical protein